MTLTCTWVKDPAGVAWETFHSLGSAPVYSEYDEPPVEQQACGSTNTCCGPAAAVTDLKSKATACCG